MNNNRMFNAVTNAVLIFIAWSVLYTASLMLDGPTKVVWVGSGVVDTEEHDTYEVQY